MSTITLTRTGPLPPRLHWHSFTEFQLPCAAGADRLAVVMLSHILKYFSLPSENLAQLKRSLADSTLKALEHRSSYQVGLPLSIRVLLPQPSIRDLSSSSIQSAAISVSPAASVEEHSSHNWSFFLVSKPPLSSSLGVAWSRYIIELFLYRESPDKPPPPTNDLFRSDSPYPSRSNSHAP